MAVVIITAYAIVAAVEIKALARKKYLRDLIVFCFFIAFSFTVSLLLSLGVKLPNPVDAIHNFLEWAGLHY